MLLLMIRVRLGLDIRGITWLHLRSAIPLIAKAACEKPAKTEEEGSAGDGTNGEPAFEPVDRPPDEETAGIWEVVGVAVQVAVTEVDVCVKEGSVLEVEAADVMLEVLLLELPDVVAADSVRFWRKNPGLETCSEMSE